MLKFLLIIGLVFYGLYKFGSLFYKAGAASQQHFREPRKSNTINIDAEPKAKKGKTYKGGEYVDYEEVK
jgi:hypothetical protein